MTVARLLEDFDVSASGMSYALNGLIEAGLACKNDPDPKDPKRPLYELLPEGFTAVKHGTIKLASKVKKAERELYSPEMIEVAFAGLHAAVRSLLKERATMRKQLAALARTAGVTS
jgi:DNA-binding transcriptional ArsR family regulator